MFLDIYKRRQLALRYMVLANRTYTATASMLVFLSIGIIVCLWINHYAVNWPRADDFASVDWFNNIVNKRMLGFHYVLSLHDGSHPLATQGLLTTESFALFGVDFKALIMLNALIVFASALALSLFCFVKSNKGGTITLLGPPVLLMIFFHPIQISHLLWAFELGWFLINLFLVVNAILIESRLRQRITLTSILCLFGAFSSAHGSVLWAAAAGHLLLKGDKRDRYPSMFFGAMFVLNIVYLSYMIPEDVNPVRLIDAGRLFVYFVQLLGTLFCQTNHVEILLQGICVMALAIVSALHALRNRERARQRLALVFMATSFVCLLQFARGRFQYGIDWALSDFHMGTMMVPLLIGIAISYLDWFSSISGGMSLLRLLALTPCIYLLVSVAFSSPFAIRYAKKLRLQQELARHFACAQDAPSYLVYGFNLGPQNKELYLRVRPLLNDLCQASDSKPTRNLLRYPEYFRELAAGRPDTAEALQALWNVYLLNLDLSRAISSNDPRQGEKLVEFAIQNANTGSHYAPEMLKPYAPVFLSLAGISATK